MSNYADNQIDTINLSIRKEKKKEYLDLKLASSVLKPSDTLKISLSNKPDLIIDSLLYFISDSTHYKNIGWKLDSNLNILEILCPKELIIYELHIDSNAIKVNGFHNKEFVNQIKILQIEETGIINGKINNYSKNNILQLLNESYKVVEELFNIESDYSFKYIKPGTYKLRLIIDDNKNGKWDDGNFKNNKLSEEVIFHNTDIIVKEKLGNKRYKHYFKILKII